MKINDMTEKDRVRFWERVNKKAPGGCWEWTAYVNKHGYGRLRPYPGQGATSAHRVAYMISNNMDLVRGNIIRHTCDNRSCCNPDHLYITNDGSSRQIEDTKRRFWAKVDKQVPDSCWEWMDNRTSKGYGQANMRGYPTHAHRIAYMLANEIGKLGSRDHVCHRCDNPPCCNPAHLFLGSPRDNMIDKTKKDRAGKILTAAQVKEIRSLYRRGNPSADMKVMSRRFGVSVDTIHKITSRKTWGHLD